MENTPTGDNSATVALSFGVQMGIAVVAMIGFSILRPKNKTVYEPRQKYAPQNKRPKPLDSQMWAWLKVLNEDYLSQSDKLGLDAIMYLRFLHFSAKYFTILTVSSIPLMILNSISNPEAAPDALLRTSMSNVPATNWLFSVFPVYAWLYTALFYYYMWKMWQEYIILRKEYFSSPEYTSAQESRTLLLTQVPSQMGSVAELQKYLDSQRLDHKAQSVLLGRNYNDLSKLVATHDEITLKLESVL
jgi:hypothetical protein